MFFLGVEGSMTSTGFLVHIDLCISGPCMSEANRLLGGGDSGLGNTTNKEWRLRRMFGRCRSIILDL